MLIPQTLSLTWRNRIYSDFKSYLQPISAREKISDRHTFFIGLCEWFFQLSKAYN